MKKWLRILALIAVTLALLGALTGCGKEAATDAPATGATVTEEPLELGNYHFYEGELMNGIPHGQGVMTWPGGETYTGAFVNGLRHGHGEYIDSNISYEGEWINDRQVGEFTRTLPDGTVNTLFYENGELTDSDAVVLEIPSSAPSGSAANTPSGSAADTSAPADSDQAILPDLAYFYSRTPNEMEKKGDSGYRIAFTKISNFEKDTILSETLALLQEPRYQLTLEDSRIVPFTKKNHKEAYDFRYTGTGSVSQMPDVEDGSIYFHVQLRITNYNDSIGLGLYYGNGFTLEDPGSRCSAETASDGGSGGGGSSGSSDGYDPYIPDASKLPCLTCDGDGDCRRCNGKGYIFRDDIRSDCTRCQRGKCPKCHGSGTR